MGDLKSKWEKEKELEEEAGARFYDRFLTLRVSIVMEMRNMIWAYKYKALEDSTVALSVQKTTSDYRQDYATILQEDNNYLSKYPRPFSKLHWTWMIHESNSNPPCIEINEP